MTNLKREKIWAVVLLAVLTGLLIGVIVRCGYLQVYQCESSRRRADRQQLKLIPQSSRRGMIVDRCGRELAVSTQVWSVGADPKALDDTIEAARRLAVILDLSGDSLYRDIEEHASHRFLWIKRFVTDEQAEAIDRLNIRGLICLREYRREYPMGTLAAHVIGYTDIDGKGLEGIESRYDEILSGQEGLWRLRSDARRRPIGAQGTAEPFHNGNIVVLTLDAVIQSTVEEQLKGVVDKFRAQSACGIVMDPETGEVLAMANYPTFDPGKARQTDLALRRNLILTDPIEPGSTFKPFTVASAIEGGFVKIDQTIYCHDGRYSGKGFGTIREYDYHKYGNLTVAECLVRSTNIGSAIMAQKMGKRYFYDMICRFGFGQKTGIDLYGEDDGILRPVSQWNDKEYTLTRVGFGQGVSVTPIQLIRAFCCLANEGQSIRPRVAKGILSPDGDKVIDDFFKDDLSKAGDGRQIISPRVAREVVSQALQAVIDRKEGTAHNAYLEGYSVFGKTGTAQIASKTHRGYEDGQYISSFLAGAPSDDPRVCVLVMVRRPDRKLGLGYTGGKVAAPVVKEILEQTLAYLGVKPQTENNNLLASGN